jgi:DNA-binding response OmpR family regulator
LILVVDDQPSVRAMVLASIRVKASRYGVVEAANGADAVAQARERQPDLVLLDVALPDHDGFWVCREQALKAGADGYIVKPFSPRALLEELDRRLG